MADCYVWDYTLKFDKNHQLKVFKDNLRSNCKTWCFQLEEGSTGYKHWQGRFSLRKKKSLSSLISFFKSYPQWVGVHFSPTANANSRNFNYVLKDDTRIAGPYCDTDAEEVEPTKQMKMFQDWDLYPYQQELLNKSKEFCLRSIDFIYDQDGNTGKSLFSEYMELKGLAEEVPPFRLMDDIFQWVASRPVKPCYIFDMPRGMKKDKLADFYSGIEIIKNGVAYDKRYAAKKKRFDRPRVFIFSNTLPQFNLMSKDRWKVWTISEKKLVSYEEALWSVVDSDEEY
ncbi:MAG: putative viral replication protein [Cressdnaviricota sp.]|nr:MAG: putative viral replication protein [Cressdnaviricota sp.]